MAQATFLGTYSSRGMPGSPKSTNNAKVFWFVWQDSVANAYLIQKLNSSYDPVGEPQLLPPALFRSTLTREPRVTIIPIIKPEVKDYLQKVFDPAQAEKSITLKDGAAVEQPANGTEAVAQPARLAKELRAEFSNHYANYKKGDKKLKDSAKEAFQRISAIREGIVPGHKHMFTDFGLDLRKIYLNELAMRHFKRAAELSPDDSHAQFNMARILYELGRYEKAREYAERALELEPDLQAAEMLIKSLKKMQASTAGANPAHGSRLSH